jgi:hypothetical protein
MYVLSHHLSLVHAENILTGHLVLEKIIFPNIILAWKTLVVFRFKMQVLRISSAFLSVRILTVEIAMSKD